MSERQRKGDKKQWRETALNLPPLPQDAKMKSENNANLLHAVKRSHRIGTVQQTFDLPVLLKQTYTLNFIETPLFVSLQCPPAVSFNEPWVPSEVAGKWTEKKWIYCCDRSWMCTCGWWRLKQLLLLYVIKMKTTMIPTADFNCW